MKAEYQEREAGWSQGRGKFIEEPLVSDPGFVGMPLLLQSGGWTS